MLTVGTYKTRGGDDVKIVAIEDGIAIGYVVNWGIEDGLSTWRADSGRFFLENDEDHSNDLIDTKPRIKGEVWLTVYRRLDDDVAAGGGYATKKAALENRGECCIAIARVEIDCVEGENLD